MATQTIPTVQNPGSSLDNLINSVTKNFGSGTTTTKETGGFSDQLTALLNNLVLGVGPYSRDQAIADAAGPMAQLAQDTLAQTVPRSAAQVRGSGLYNSSTKALLDNDAQARLATQMAALVQKNITDYATINANNVNATANANRTNTTKTTSSGNNSKALLSALAPLLLGEGKKLAGNLFSDSATDKTASAATDALGSLGSAVQSTVGNIGDFFGGADPLSSSSSSFLGDDGSFGDLLGGSSDLGSDLLGGAGDLLGNLGSGIGDFFSNFSDMFSNIDIGSNFGDIFGGLFAEGGVVPVKSAKAAAPEGEIKGPKSASGKDNMLIAVQGGEGILHTGVMSQPGMAKFVDSLNEMFAGAR